MADYVRACALADLADESAISVVLRAPDDPAVDGRPVCVARTEGEVFALADECSHAEIPLSEGDIADGTVECWLHGSRFDLRTGRPTGLPATQPVPTYPVKIDGDDVLVALEA